MHDFQVTEARYWKSIHFAAIYLLFKYFVKYIIITFQLIFYTELKYYLPRSQSFCYSS